MDAFNINKIEEKNYQWNTDTCFFFKLETILQLLKTKVNMKLQFLLLWPKINPPCNGEGVQMVQLSVPALAEVYRKGSDSKSLRRSKLQNLLQLVDALWNQSKQQTKGHSCAQVKEYQKA